MFRKKQIVGILFVIAVFALIATGMKSPVMGTNFEKLTKEEATRRWETSGHGDETSEAFRHWDEDDPAVVSTSCARCHSTDGFVDFIADGTVDTAPNAEEDIGVECEVCHANPDTGTLRGISAVGFPSGRFIENLGPEAICMQCHQGRESAVTINNDIASAAAAGVTDPDAVSSRLRFRNVHYAAAGATNMGTLAMGGYQYDGKTYDARFAHVDGYNACMTCHDPHTLEVRLDNCATCHTDPANTSYWGGINDPKNIRFLGSCVDYDGDGNMHEGIYYEIETLEHMLYSAIQNYAKNVIGVPIAYNAASYPYFFIDTNGNGVADSDEAVRANAYSTFSARLAKATYNYQFVLKDHGGFAHGGKYMIQLMYDSIEDLNTALGEPKLMQGLARRVGINFQAVPNRIGPRVESAAAGITGLNRVDEGHFDGSAEAWRHWDEDGEVSSSCAKCHSATGLADFLDNENIDDTHHISNGLLCTTCHTSPPTVRSVPSVTFPSGAVASLGDNSNICMLCHQGRASKATIDSRVAGKPPYSFSNIHYFPVAAIFFGTEVQGAYEYEGKSYTGRKTYANHNGRFTTCIQCHMGTLGLCDDCGDDPCNHNVQKPNPGDCVLCHGQDVSQPYKGSDPAKFKFSGIRPGSTPDLDADGNRTESLENEIRGLEAVLLALIKNYATNVLAKPILYDAHGYPYFFNDKNGNGLLDPDEASSGNAYRSFDAKLLKAAYNYHTSIKEPHGFIHNSRYVAQFLVDSIGDLGGNTAPYTWR